MQDRNVAMCNVADLCLAVYDGSKGGTDNCVKAYRQKSPRHLIIYHPRLNTITVEKG
jgi:hypothetical protein